MNKKLVAPDLIRGWEGEGCASTGHHTPHPSAASRLPPSPRRGEGLVCLLAPLPVAALRLSPEANRTLVRLGLKTIGDLAGVPRTALARRFGKEDHPLDALDRALGRKPEPLTALPEDLAPRALLPFKEPVTHPEAGAQALGILVERLAAELQARQLGARELRLVGYRIDGSLAEVGVATSIPTRAPDHLLRLLTGALERTGLDPGFGIDAIALEVRWWERLASAQGGLAGEEQGHAAVAALIDRLSVKLGAEKVRRPVAVDSHVPERAAGWEVGIASSPSPRPREGGSRASAEGRGGVGIASAPTPSHDVRVDPLPQGERVSKLLDRPEEIAVIYATPEGLPRRFVWRRKVHDIARAQGPQRIAPEWWRLRSTARLRDYYKVEDSTGVRFWIFREGVVGDGRGGAPLWFVQGLYA